MDDVEWTTLFPVEAGGGDIDSASTSVTVWWERECVCSGRECVCGGRVCVVGE